MKRIFKSTTFILLGILCILGAAGLTAYNLNHDDEVGTRTEDIETKLEDYIFNQDHTNQQATSLSSLDDNYNGMVIVGYDANGEPILQYNHHADSEYNFDGFDGDRYEGILEIPCMGIRLPVYSRWSMEMLENCPCVLYGSIEDNHLVIGAHTYSSHFGNIRFIDDGEIVYFYDINGIRHKYIIDAHEIITPDMADYLCKSDYELTIFTCTWYGYKRNAVRCIEVFD